MLYIIRGGQGAIFYGNIVNVSNKYQAMVLIIRYTYVKTLACEIIPTLLYLHFKVKFLVHEVILLYNYTYSVVVDPRTYTTFNDIQNYRDIFLYYRDSRSHSLSPSPKYVDICNAANKIII